MLFTNRTVDYFRIKFVLYSYMSTQILDTAKLLSNFITMAWI
jgi:hypothetical protein